MASSPQVESGTAGGCLLNGCITLSVLFLVIFTSAWIWVSSRPERDEAEARADLRATVEAHQRRLSRAAADGGPRDAEIARLFPAAKPADGLIDVRRHAESTTVVAELLGRGPSRTFVFVHETTVKGCYAFHLPSSDGGAPRVSVRQLLDKTCTARPPARTPTP